MLERLGRFAVRRRRWVLIGTVIGVILAGAVGGSVVKNLSNGGFTDPNSDSQRADDVLAKTFHGGVPNFVLLVTVRDGTVDDATAAQAGAALTQRLGREPGIPAAFPYWTLGELAAPRRTDSTDVL